MNIFLGRNVRTSIPNSQNRKTDIEENIRRREERVKKWAEKSGKKYNRELFNLGDKVMIKNMKSGKYDIEGTVEDSREEIVTRNGGMQPAAVGDSRSYVIHGTEGGVYLRNCKFIKKKIFNE